jgi:dihydropyrimidine dehydrogenase (NAD+) subunit PreA
VVWKTIGDPIVNVASRYSALNYGKDRMIGLNNIELISDRSPETNFREIAEVKKRWPNHAVIASLMVDTRERWHEFVKRAADSGADGIELNYGCPHGMCERGMGSAVGQQPAVAEKITSWVMEVATIPVIVKLTPNITDVTAAARAARRAGANAISLINTINSITNVNLDTFVPEPTVSGRSSHGGYCGPAVKPIALNMVQSCAADPDVRLPISGIGGIGTWRDAAEFLALGLDEPAGVHRHHALRLPHRGRYERGPERLPRQQGHEVGQRAHRPLRPDAAEMETLDLRWQRVARIDYDKCIGCNLCYIACEDGAHQCIDLKAPQELGVGLGPGRVPASPCRRCARKIASAATFAASSARSTTASR